MLGCLERRRGAGVGCFELLGALGGNRVTDVLDNHRNLPDNELKTSFQ